MAHYEIDGEKIEYRIIKGRGRHIYLRVGDDLNFELVMPKNSRTQPEKVLMEKKAWIKKKKRQYGHLKDLRDSGKAMYRGQEYALEYSPARRDHVEVAGDRLMVSYRGDAALALEKWLKKKAKEYLEENVREYAGILGVGYNRVYVKDSSSRWGSCSGRKNLSFNYRMICLPEDLREYLIVHELAHLKEMNHSERYWKIVEALIPDRKERDKRLRSYLPGMRIV